MTSSAIAPADPEITSRAGDAAAAVTERRARSDIVRLVGDSRVSADDPRVPEQRFALIYGE